MAKVHITILLTFFFTHLASFVSMEIQTDDATTDIPADGTSSIRRSDDLQRILVSSSVHAVIDYDVTIQCNVSLSSDVNYNVTWILPNGGNISLESVPVSVGEDLKGKKYQLSSLEDNIGQTSFTMSIFNVTSSDAGMYVCDVTMDDGNTTGCQITLLVHAPPTPPTQCHVLQNGATRTHHVICLHTRTTSGSSFSRVQYTLSFVRIGAVELQGIPADSSKEKVNVDYASKPVFVLNSSTIGDGYKGKIQLIACTTFTEFPEVKSCAEPILFNTAELFSTHDDVDDTSEGSSLAVQIAVPIVSVVVISIIVVVLVWVFCRKRSKEKTGNLTVPPENSSINERSVHSVQTQDTRTSYLSMSPTLDGHHHHTPHTSSSTTPTTTSTSSATKTTATFANCSRMSEQDSNFAYENRNNGPKLIASNVFGSKGTVTNINGSMHITTGPITHTSGQTRPPFSRQSSITSSRMSSVSSLEDFQVPIQESETLSHSHTHFPFQDQPGNKPQNRDLQNKNTGTHEISNCRKGSGAHSCNDYIASDKIKNRPSFKSRRSSSKDLERGDRSGFHFHPEDSKEKNAEHGDKQDKNNRKQWPLSSLGSTYYIDLRERNYQHHNYENIEDYDQEFDELKPSGESSYKIVPRSIHETKDSASLSKKVSVLEENRNRNSIHDYENQRVIKFNSERNELGLKPKPGYVKERIEQFSTSSSQESTSPKPVRYSKSFSKETSNPSKCYSNLPCACECEEAKGQHSCSNSSLQKLSLSQKHRRQTFDFTHREFRTKMAASSAETMVDSGSSQSFEDYKGYKLFKPLNSKADRNRPNSNQKFDSENLKTKHFDDSSRFSSVSSPTLNRRSGKSKPHMDHSKSQTTLIDLAYSHHPPHFPNFHICTKHLRRTSEPHPLDKSKSLSSLQFIHTSAEKDDVTGHMSIMSPTTSDDEDFEDIYGSSSVVVPDLDLPPKLPVKTKHMSAFLTAGMSMPTKNFDDHIYAVPKNNKQAIMNNDSDQYCETCHDDSVCSSDRLNHGLAQKGRAAIFASESKTNVPPAQSHCSLPRESCFKDTQFQDGATSYSQEGEHSMQNVLLANNKLRSCQRNRGKDSVTKIYDQTSNSKEHASNLETMKNFDDQVSMETKTSPNVYKSRHASADDAQNTPVRRYRRQYRAHSFPKESRSTRTDTNQSQSAKLKTSQSQSAVEKLYNLRKQYQDSNRQRQRSALSRSTISELGMSRSRSGCDLDRQNNSSIKSTTGNSARGMDVKAGSKVRQRSKGIIPHPDFSRYWRKGELLRPYHKDDLGGE